jgi:hypothetical protein
MRAYRFILTGVFVMWACSSCTTLITVTKSIAPEIVTGRKPLRAVFVNKFNYSDDSIVGVKHRETYSRAVHSFIGSFSGSFHPNDSIEIIVGDSLMKGTPPGMLTTLLPVEAVTDYCSRYNADIMVVLDSVNIGFDSKADYLESVSLVNVYSRSFKLYGEYFLSVYVPNGDEINRTSVDKEILYSWRMGVTSEAAFIPSVGNVKRKIDKIAMPAGVEYANKFRTTSENVEMRIYNGMIFDKSVQLMRSGKWDEAVKELQNLADKSHGSVAMHAKVNLEVAKEGLGEDKRQPPSL